MNKDKLQPEGGWILSSKPHLPVPGVAERGVRFRSLSLVSGLFGRKEIPGVLSTLNINPRLFWPWLYFASKLMPFGRLAASDREKIILRTAWNCRSRYEWGQHLEIAQSAGVSDEEVVKVSMGPIGFADRHEKALIQACDDIVTRKCMSDATWDILAEKFRKDILVEIVILIGHYEMIAGFLNTAGIALEAPIEENLQAFHRRLRDKDVSPGA